MKLENISYANLTYPVATVDIPGFGACAVAPESLENALIGDDGDPRDESAACADEAIFFYVPDEIFDGGEAEIVRYTTENLV